MVGTQVGGRERLIHGFQEIRDISGVWNHGVRIAAKVGVGGPDKGQITPWENEHHAAVPPCRESECVAVPDFRTREEDVNPFRWPDCGSRSARPQIVQPDSGRVHNKPR